MRCESTIPIKRIGKNGTNTKGLKKKPKFKETYSTTSSSM
jgi:hypothetical protein